MEKVEIIATKILYLIMTNLRQSEAFVFLFFCQLILLLMTDLSRKQHFIHLKLAQKGKVLLLKPSLFWKPMYDTH